MNKKVILVGIILFCLLVSLPSTIGDSKSSENYNLEVSIKPMRYAFPRIYYGNSQPIGFYAGASNLGHNTSPPFTLKFEIIRIFDNVPYNYNMTYDFDSFHAYSGESHRFIWFTVPHGHFSIYEARASISVNDNNTLDNMQSYKFIVIRR